VRACVEVDVFFLFDCVVKRRERALLNERRTVLPSSDPTLALVVVPPPGFLRLDDNGWRPSWFDEVGVAAGQPGVAEDGGERQQHWSPIFRWGLDSAACIWSLLW